jgi:hypothetical protein
MPDLNAVIGQMFQSNAFGGLMYWLGYGLLAVVILLVFAVAYYLLTFDHKVMVFPVYGSGKDGIFSVQKPKSNRIRWIKKQTAWRKLWPLFNNKDIEPFDAEYIYPGKRIYAFELNNEWIPGRVNIDKSEQTMRAEINPVPYFVRNWQGLQYKQNAMEYANPGWWDENKHLVLGVMTVLICIIGMLISIYLTYKYLAPGRADWSQLMGAIGQAGTVPGIGPH